MCRLVCHFSIIFLFEFLKSTWGVFRFQQLLAICQHSAAKWPTLPPLALTSVPLRCCKLSQNMVIHRAQQNLGDFTAIAIDNASRSQITATSNNLLAIASARNACFVAFQQIASKLLQTEQSHGRHF